MTTEFILAAALALGIAVLLVGVWDLKMRDRADRVRLDTLEKNQWQVGCIDGQFGVLAGSPPKIIGVGLRKDLREAIDGAVAESVLLREF
jgi:hypothetical protein